MADWTTELVSDLLLVLAGGIVGVVSTTWSEWWRDRKRRAAVEAAISVEFREIAYRMTLAVYLFERRAGRFNRELLSWVHAQAKRYEGPNPREGVLAGLDHVLAKGDAEINEAADLFRASTSPFFVPSVDAPFATATVGQFHDLRPTYAAAVMDVLAHLRMFNEVREETVHFRRLTFEPGLTAQNHESARSNVEQGEAQMSSRARIVVDKITALERRSPDR